MDQTACPQIDPVTEIITPVAKLATERTGKRPAPAVIWRWRKYGVRGVKLPMVHFSGTWCTTVAAWGWWIEQQTAEASKPRADLAVTDEQLQAAGLL